MSDLICGKTMMRCQTPGMCAPYGGCTPQPVIESALKADYDTLRTANQRLEGEVKALREALQGWLNLFPKQGVSGGPITTQKERTKSVLSSSEVSK